MKDCPIGCRCNTCRPDLAPARKSGVVEVPLAVDVEVIERATKEDLIRVAAGLDGSAMVSVIVAKVGIRK